MRAIYNTKPTVLFATGTMGSIRLVYYIIDNAYIYCISFQAGAGILQNFIIGLLGSMCFHIAFVIMRRMKLHGYFISFGHNTVTVVKMIINAIRPIVASRIGCSLDVVTVDIEFAPNIINRFIDLSLLIDRVDARCVTSGRTWLVVIINQINIHGFTTVGAVPSPTIDDIISVINQRTYSPIAVSALAKPRGTAIVMCQ